ncbi:hypothetical protein QT971_17145 [Microcoleus sp. herbarium19]
MPRSRSRCHTQPHTQRWMPPPDFRSQTQKKIRPKFKPSNSSVESIDGR